MIGTWHLTQGNQDTIGAYLEWKFSGACMSVRPGHPGHEHETQQFVRQCCLTPFPLTLVSAEI
jgi:hypothetical protein